MYISISQHNPQPLYQQIINQIKDGVANDRIPSNTSLPSIRVLAKELQVSVITVKRAYTELESEGFLITRPGLGSFVAPLNHQELKKIQLREAKEQLKILLNKSSISTEDLIQILRELEEQHG